MKDGGKVRDKKRGRTAIPVGGRKGKRKGRSTIPVGGRTGGRKPGKDKTIPGAGTSGDGLKPKQPKQDVGPKKNESEKSSPTILEEIMIGIDMSKFGYSKGGKVNSSGYNIVGESNKYKEGE